MGCEYRNQDYLFVRDALNNITAITHRNKRIVARYKYDTWGNCTVYNEDGEIDTDPISIGNVNPFRWKSYYLDLESNLYYANGVTTTRQRAVRRRVVYRKRYRKRIEVATVLTETV